jgi:hypothetical protein
LFALSRCHHRWTTEFIDRSKPPVIVVIGGNRRWVDRATRSLADFPRLVEIFDAQSVWQRLASVPFVGRDE